MFDDNSRLPAPILSRNQVDLLISQKERRKEIIQHLTDLKCWLEVITAAVDS